MNRIFKTVWNAVRRQLVVVNEATSSTGQARLKGAVRGGVAASILALLPGLSFAAPDLTPTTIGGIDFFEYEKGIFTLLQDDQSTSTQTTWTGCFAITGATLIMKSNSFGMLYQSIAADGDTGTFSIGPSSKVQIIGGDEVGTNAITHMANSNGQATIINYGVLELIGGEGQNVHGIGSVGAYGGIGTINNEDGATMLVQGGFYSDTTEGDMGQDSNGIGANARYGGTGHINNKGSGTITFIGGPGTNSNGMHHNAVNENSVGYIVNEGTGSIVFQGGAVLRANGVSSNAYGAGATAYILNNGTGEIKIIGGSYNATDLNEGTEGLSTNAYGGAQGTISNNAGGTIDISGGTGAWAAGMASNAQDEGSVGSIVNTLGTMIIQGGSGESSVGIYQNAVLDAQGTITNKGESLTIQGGSGKSAFGLALNGDRATGLIENLGSGELLVAGGIGEGASGINGNARNDGGVGDIINRADGVLTIQGGSGVNAHGMDVNANNATGNIVNEGSGKLSIIGGSSDKVYGIGYNSTSSGSGTILNSGEGDLLISGGSAQQAIGLFANDYQNASQATIENSGSGNLTISGGSGVSAYGLGWNTYGGSYGKIANSGIGNLLIVGGQAEGSYGIYQNAASGGNATIENTSEQGTLIIQAGTVKNAHGMLNNASGAKTSGTISNNNLGELIIQGSSAENTFGLSINGRNHGYGYVYNLNGGALTIQGGSGYYSAGIQINGTDKGQGIISNVSNGVLKIIGGSAENASGLDINAYIYGLGYIQNEGNGELIIQGGSTSGAYGVRFNAYDVAEIGGAIISNNDWNPTSVLKILGGTGIGSMAMRANSYNSRNAIIRNDGNSLVIQGGLFEDSIAIYANAESSSKYAEGNIQNSSEGILSILGSSAHRSIGLFANAYGDYSARGNIINDGGGTLIIQGGSGQDAYGISYNAYATASTNSTIMGVIDNEAGELSIIGGDSKTAYGLYVNAFQLENLSGSNAYAEIYTIGSTLNILGNVASGIYVNAANGAEGAITNDGDGILNILGDKEKGSYAITCFTVGASTSRLENYGTMNLNANAIQQFVGSGTPTSISVVNYGTVNAEAEAIFQMGSKVEETYAPIPITVYSPDKGTRTEKLDSFESLQSIVVGSAWELKDDWEKYSTWEDGGKLIINNIVAGTEAAQQITEAFQNKFGTGTTIEFTGTAVNTASNASGISTQAEYTRPEFTLKHVDEMIESGQLVDGEIITSEVLYYDIERHHTGGANSLNPRYGDITVATSFNLSEETNSDIFHHYMNQDIGFKGIMEYDTINVQDGHTLTLVGEQASMAMALRADDSGASFLLTDAQVTVDADSTLKLGISDLSATQGYFDYLDMTDESATLSVENGIFEISIIAGSGVINIQDKGELTLVTQALASNVSNKGVLNAKKFETIIGQSTVSTYADFNEPSGTYGQYHFKTFTNEKGAEANFADVSITEGANVKNKAEAVINAGSVELQAGAVITNFSDAVLNFDSFTMNGTLRNNGTINVGGEMALAQGTSTTLAGKVKAGVLSVGRPLEANGISLMNDPATSLEITGETYSDELDLVSGDVFVRKDAVLAGVKLKDNIVNSHVTVDTDGTFAFSYTENGLKDALEDYKGTTDGKALAVLSTDLSFGENGSLTVGTTDAKATVNLGSDALVLLGTDSLHGKAVLNGEGKETLNIKDGAELAFVDDAIWGNHYLVRDFVDTDDAANLIVKDMDGNILEAYHNDKGIYVTIGGNDISDKDENFALVDNINSILDGLQDTTSNQVDIKYLSQAMGAKDGVKQTNDLEHLSAQAGVLSEAYRLTDNAHESIIRHAMSDKYSNVWVEALAGKGGVDGAGTGYGDASYDSDSYGMIFGLDGRIGQSINVGAAIHYQKGDLEADSSQTKNEFKNYGASVYAGTNFGNLNVTAGLTYAKGDHEFNQVNLGYVEGDTDTEVFMGGIRASYPIMLDRILITPYAGIEAVHVKEDGFKATIGGAQAFDFGSISETFGRVPMGVKLSGGNAKFAGYADISVIPQFGNRDAKQSVSGVNTKATDVAKFDYADSVLGRVKMGAAYQVNKSTTLGVSYGASMGDVRDLSHEFSLNAKYRF